MAPEPQILILEDRDGGDWALCRVRYLDEVTRQRDELLDALTIAAASCSDVTRVGRFIPAVDPVRWVQQLEAHLRQAIKAEVAR